MAAVKQSKTEPEKVLRLPLITLRGLTVTPHAKLQITAARSSSIEAFNAAQKHKEKLLAVFCQVNDEDDKPTAKALHEIGVICRLIALQLSANNTCQALIDGFRRIRLLSILDDEGQPYREAQIELLSEPEHTEKQLQQTLSMLHSSLEYALENQQVKAVKPLVDLKVPSAVVKSVREEQDLSRMTDLLTQVLYLEKDLKLMLLKTLDPLERARLLIGALNDFSYKSEIENKILNEAKESMERNQRDYFLHEQLRAIRKELGVTEQEDTEIDELKAKELSLKAPKYVHDRLKKEIKKLSNMGNNSSEATIVRSYIDTLLTFPWEEQSKVNHDLKKAQETLEQDHYGLKKVKERILEYLAVQSKADKLHGPILCLMGPPGIGKTSLGESIARATGRKFVRISLGGVYDEAEIRGHRRTYVGALPGRIIQNMLKVKVNNPLFLLDEIDKIGDSRHGDPAAALLEVLDPEQNKSFSDNYVELDTDLSNVMFVTTANSYHISGPLLDRMEIIDLPSYTEDEKFHIAKEHLLPKQLKLNSLTQEEFSIDDETLIELIRYYTHEAGVRGLERLINELCRKAVKEFMLSDKKPKGRSKKIDRRVIDKKILAEMLGPRRYDFTSKLKDSKVGLVNGLAWTSLGGDILQLEAVANVGKGKHILTGKLGEVMKESISAAITLVRSLSEALKLNPAFYEQCDLHIHVPEGATPKEGPSAGIGMVTAIVSALTGNPVKASVAMTGEITLRGDILPIGGLKEKLLAALRGGIQTVFIPQENEKDLWDIPQNVKDGLEIKPVKRIEEVLAGALEHNPWKFSPTTVWNVKKAVKAAKSSKSAAEPKTKATRKA
ncbi:MAG: endopeptidase La [Succinivibrio sp.]|nr:endopeptidase La [Succinivibrio sp.]